MGEKKFFGNKAIIGSWLVIFVNIGVCSTLGVFIAQLAAYSGWDISKCVLIGTINTVVNLLLSFVAIPLANKIGYRKIMAIAVIAVCVHINLYTFITPGMTGGSLALMYIAGGIASVAIAFGSHGIIGGLVAKWFLDIGEREKRTTIATTGAGVGAAVWVALAGVLFTKFTWQQCYRIITIIAAVIGVIALVCLIREPEKCGQQPKPAEGNTKAVDPSELVGVTQKQALKSPAFWLLVIGILCSVTACSGIISYAAAFWQGMGMSPSASSMWTALYLLISAIFGFIAGAMFKKLKNSGYTLITHICMIICFVLMLAWGRSQGNMMMVLIVITAGICYPIDAAFPALISHGMFGAKDIAKIIGTLMAAIYAGQLISSLCASALLATPGGFTTLWTVFAIMSIIGMVVCMLAIAVSPMRKINKQAKLNA